MKSKKNAAKTEFYVTVTRTEVFNLTIEATSAQAAKMKAMDEELKEPDYCDLDYEAHPVKRISNRE